MKAYITSIGEPTTALSKWSLERNGFEVEIIENRSSLWQKLKELYEMVNEDFLRVDADTIVNKNCIPQALKDLYLNNKFMNSKFQEAWWIQLRTYDWFKQDITHGGLQFIRREALPDLRANIDRFTHLNRPETELSRIEAFYNPRRFESYDYMIMGLNNYKNDMQRVKQVKLERNQYQTYDWELAEKLNALP